MRYFIDCGYYVGGASKQWEWLTDEMGWKTYKFEPNPTLEVPDDVIKEAVWIEDGEMAFTLEGRHDAAHLGEGLMSVPTFDFSRFIADLPDVEGIICSMDIEGSEFEVLRKMLDEDTIDKVKVLDIEFHHRLILDYTKEDAEQLIDEIKRRGTKIILKVPLE